MDIIFNGLEELYKRIKPALRTKKEEMKRRGFIYIKEEDIWNYLKDKKWINSKNLTLYQMVDDVLNVDDIVIDNYLKEKLKMRNRNVYFDEGDLDDKK